MNEQTVLYHLGFRLRAWLLSNDVQEEDVDAWFTHWTMVTSDYSLGGRRGAELTAGRLAASVRMACFYYRQQTAVTGRGTDE